MSKSGCIILFIICSSFILSWPVLADTVYLKNGRTISGLIKNEDSTSLQVELPAGTVTFNRNMIAKIDRSSQAQAQNLRQQWQQSRRLADIKSTLTRKQWEDSTKSVDFSKAGGHIMVNVELNRDIPANLLLDTGASVVVVSRQIGQRLGLDMDSNENIMPLRLANGNIAYAKRFILKSVRVDKVDTENVEAAALLQDDPSNKVGDGLLGMSFLNKFNFKVDYTREQLVLEKRN